MPWVIPSFHGNVSSMVKKANVFSGKLRTIETCDWFVLAEKKTAKLHLPFTRRDQNPAFRLSYRIMTRPEMHPGRPALKIATSLDLKELRNNEWKHCKTELSGQIPRGIPIVQQWKWLRSYFTNMAIENGAEAAIDEDDEGFFSTARTNMMRGLRSVFRKGSSASSPGHKSERKEPRSSSVESELRKGARRSRKSSTLFGTSWRPWRRTSNPQTPTTRVPGGPPFDLGRNGTKPRPPPPTPVLSIAESRSMPSFMKKNQNAVSLNATVRRESPEDVVRGSKSSEMRPSTPTASTHWHARTEANLRGKRAGHTRESRSHSPIDRAQNTPSQRKTRHARRGSFPSSMSPEKIWAPEPKSSPETDGALPAGAPRRALQPSRGGSMGTVPDAKRALVLSDRPASPVSDSVSTSTRRRRSSASGFYQAMSDVEQSDQSDGAFVSQRKKKKSSGAPPNTPSVRPGVAPTRVPVLQTNVHRSVQMDETSLSQTTRSESQTIILPFSGHFLYLYILILTGACMWVVKTSKPENLGVTLAVVIGALYTLVVSGYPCEITLLLRQQRKC